MTLEATISLWQNRGPALSANPLDRHLTTDICIVGAGIAGLTTGYLLSLQGREVVIIDQGEIGGGQTVRTTAHLSSALDDGFHQLENLFGLEGAALAYQSHEAAIRFIEELIRATSIDCDFQKLEAYLFNPPEYKENILSKEFQAAVRAGMTAEMVTEVPLSGYQTGPAIRFSEQAIFQPMRYLKGLYELVLSNGGNVFSKTHASSFEEIESGFIVRTKIDYSIKCQQLVITTNSPVNNRFFPHLKQAAYRTYTICGSIPKGSVFNALYYDTEDPYHYVRLARFDDDRDYLIVGGEDHRTGEYPYDSPNEVFHRLEAWTKERFPMYTQSEYQWSGQIIEPIDHLAFIGKGTTKNTYIATGDSGHGMTHGTIAGILITDLINERSNPWTKLYDPHRKTLKAYSTFAEENWNTTLQYGDWLTPGEVKSIEDIPLGEGGILREGMKKIAVYRDKEGNTHRLSAVCPHLKGLVRWNKVEKTWDCPCHGSRFSKEGEVIEGPALNSLSKEPT